MKPEIILTNRLTFLPRVLIDARVDQGITQLKLANKLGLKMQQVQRWEKQKYEHIGFDNLCAVAKALNVGFTIIATYG